jgi:hydrogenase/urease accessory protein HupE
MKILHGMLYGWFLQQQAHNVAGECSCAFGLAERLIKVAGTQLVGMVSKMLQLSRKLVTESLYR